MSRKNTSQETLADYLTVSEAAALLGVSSSTLRNWDKAGKLKAYRHPINKYRLYNGLELKRLLEEIRENKPREEEHGH